MLQDLWNDITQTSDAVRCHLPAIRTAYEYFDRQPVTPGSTLMTGLATSMYAWLAVESLVRPLGVQIVDTGELIHYHPDLLRDCSDLLVMSRSGESAEIVRLLESDVSGRRLVSVTEDNSSTLARKSDVVFSYSSGEISFVNTASFSISMALTLGIACAMNRIPVERVESAVCDAAAGVERICGRMTHAAETVAQALSEANAIMVVARGSLVGVGSQFALDLQEGLRLPAIVVPGSMLRHGPIEMTCRPDVGTLFLATDDEPGRAMRRAADEISQRGAGCVVIGPESLCASGPSRTDMIIPQADLLAQPIIYAAALHLIYYKMALHRGLGQIKPALVERVTRVE